jgi:hypothetical protein
LNPLVCIKTCSAILIFAISWVGFLRAQEFAEASRVDAAVQRAASFLLSQQQKNGSIADRGNENAMTSLAIMALASVGHQPSDPTPEGAVMKKGLQFVLGNNRQDRAGYFGASDGSRMYGHGIVTLMLTEMIGMGGDELTNDSIHEACQKAIDLIVRSQRAKKPAFARGGWRYTPDSADSDLSVSVWQLMALRSAKNDGLAVPSATIDDAIGYLVRSFTSPVNPPKQSKNGFSYEANNDSPTFTMSAAGLLAMQVCGQYDSPLVVGATEWLVEHPPRWDERFVLYGLYYYAQGMHQRGGEIAENASKIVATELLAHQLENGSWQSSSGEENNAGNVYCTALAILSLSVKFHYLPIYQR